MDFSQQCLSKCIERCSPGHVVILGMSRFPRVMGTELFHAKYVLRFSLSSLGMRSQFHNVFFFFQPLFERIAQTPTPPSSILDFSYLYSLWISA